MPHTKSSDNIDATVTKADEALFEAKNGGRNRVVVASTEA